MDLKFESQLCPRLILYEKSPRWAPALRLALGSHQSCLLEIRSLAAARDLLQPSTFSLVALEITPGNLDSSLAFIAHYHAEHPHAALVTLLTPETLSVEQLFREAGAIDVASSVLEAPRLARLALRHFHHAPKQPLTLRHFVTERLPWSAHATISFTSR